jgi:hypothetical protein
METMVLIADLQHHEFHGAANLGDFYVLAMNHENIGVMVTER